MTGDGWEKGSDGIWAKDGKKASFTIITTAGDKRRELTEQVIQPQLKTAGFDMKIKNTNARRPASDEVLPNGNYDLIALSRSGRRRSTPGLCTAVVHGEHPRPGQRQLRVTTGARPTSPPPTSSCGSVDTSLDDADAGKAAAKEADQIAGRGHGGAAARPAPGHPRSGTRRSSARSRTTRSGHVLEHRSVGSQAVGFPKEWHAARV